jgi:hypothetical protein
MREPPFAGVLFSLELRAMPAPTKRPKLIVIEHRVREATLIVARQQARLDKLRGDGQATADAEDSLRIYQSALEHLEALLIRLRQEATTRRH